LIQISQDPVERALAISRAKFLWDQEAKERGAREEGTVEGIEIRERRGLIEAAKKLISNGIDSKVACEMLGISESELP
jgi:predicted transposase/invertase (TIGR01784 family)